MLKHIVMWKLKEFAEGKTIYTLFETLSEKQKQRMR